jgi:hypothetical protein
MKILREEASVQLCAKFSDAKKGATKGHKVLIKFHKRKGHYGHNEKNGHKGCYSGKIVH